jgi:hypothetical protein
VEMREQVSHPGVAREHAGQVGEPDGINHDDGILSPPKGVVLHGKPRGSNGLRRMMKGQAACRASPSNLITVDPEAS